MEKSIKQFPKERHPEQRNPGDPEPERGLPGSIEQQLDMCEEGSLRGDELMHRHGVELPGEKKALRGEPLGVDELMQRNPFEIDMAEESREGSEMSGDEHSRGLQGGDTGLPGEQSRREEYFEAHSHEIEAAEFLPEDLEPPIPARRSETLAPVPRVRKRRTA